MERKECLLLVKDEQNLKDIQQVLQELSVNYDEDYHSNCQYDLIISDYHHHYKANNLVLISKKPYDKNDVLIAKQKQIILAYHFYNQQNWLDILNSYFIQNNSKKKLIQEVNSLKLVNQAKLVLINYLGMSEKQAHYFIEKQAMDNQISKELVAKEIIKTYG